MTRQEAIDIMHYESFEVRDFINKIYDDFESRICKNCTMFGNCLIRNALTHIDLTGFGCVDFERKDK